MNRNDLGPIGVLSGKRVLVVCSTGGHLEQAVRWVERLGNSNDVVFVTFKSRQSESLLKNLEHYFIDYIPPRSPLMLIAAARRISVILRVLGEIDYIVSTGAGVALSAYLVAVLQRKPMIYIESVSRFEAPSVSGRILSHMPACSTFTQHSTYESARWVLVPSLLDDYELRMIEPKDERPQKIFVTLGTIEPYRFDAAVDQIKESLTDTCEVVWQLGATSREDLPGKVVKVMSSEEFSRTAEWADIVITHAGVGSILKLLEEGISPIVMPRRKYRGEHVDDHQMQVAGALARRGLVSMVEPPEFSAQTLSVRRPSVARDVKGTR